MTCQVACVMHLMKKVRVLCVVCLHYQWSQLPEAVHQNVHIPAGSWDCKLSIWTPEALLVQRLSAHNSHLPRKRRPTHYLLFVSKRVRTGLSLTVLARLAGGIRFALLAATERLMARNCWTDDSRTQVVCNSQCSCRAKVGLPSLE